MKKTVKAEIDVCMYASAELMKDSRAINEISIKVNDVLERKKKDGKHVFVQSLKLVKMLFLFSYQKRKASYQHSYPSIYR